MRKELEENEIFVAFTGKGSTHFSRGIYDTKDFWDITDAFVVPDDTPLYQISNYWGYHKIPEAWISVEVEKCICGKTLESVSEDKTPYQFCSVECMKKGK